MTRFSAPGSSIWTEIKVHSKVYVSKRLRWPNALFPAVVFSLSCWFSKLIKKESPQGYLKGEKGFHSPSLKHGQIQESPAWPASPVSVSLKLTKPFPHFIRYQTHCRADLWNRLMTTEGLASLVWTIYQNKRLCQGRSWAIVLVCSRTIFFNAAI